jgi:hypothetical protein
MESQDNVNYMHVRHFKAVSILVFSVVILCGLSLHNFIHQGSNINVFTAIRTSYITLKQVW